MSVCLVNHFAPMAVTKMLIEFSHSLFLFFFYHQELMAIIKLSFCKNKSVRNMFTFDAFSVCHSLSQLDMMGVHVLAQNSRIAFHRKFHKI